MPPLAIASSFSLAVRPTLLLLTGIFQGLGFRCCCQLWNIIPPLALRPGKGVSVWLGAWDHGAGHSSWQTDLDCVRIGALWAVIGLMP